MNPFKKAYLHLERNRKKWLKEDLERLQQQLELKNDQIHKLEKQITESRNIPMEDYYQLEAEKMMERIAVLTAKCNRQQKELRSYRAAESKSAGKRAGTSTKTSKAKQAKSGKSTKKPTKRG